MRRLSIALVCVALAAISRDARAQAKPKSKVTEYSAYEKDTIKSVLKDQKETIDPAPEGKVIERIDVVRLEVLEERDPIPDNVPFPSIQPSIFISLAAKRPTIPARTILNALHTTSKDFIIRREMLLQVGDRYEQITIDETARNMRARMPLQVSIVLIIPVKSTTPGKVRLLVITKDIWSLRLSTDVSATSGGVENFILVPQETNFLGLHHTASTRFQYQPETYTLGVGYNVPRFGQSWIGASTSASVTINRASLEPEGSAASLTVGQGLYSTRAEWAWSASGSYAVGVARRYSNAHVFLFDSQTTQANDKIPYEYKSRSASGSVGLTRSFGWGIKNNFGLTMNVSTADYQTYDLSAFDAKAAADFTGRALPRGETRVYPALTWATFQNDFMRTLDIATLALQEDYRLGHDVSVTVYPVLKELGSTRTFFGASGKVGYNVRLGDGLAGANVTALAEDQDGSITDGSVGASLGAVTPRLGVGRIVMNASFLNRYKNYLNARTFSGGDDRLRGYPSNFFFGKDSVFYNIEFRSRPVALLQQQFGAVAFYDAGDVAQGFDMLRAKQSTGVGFRWLIPQINRIVFRVDLAFPLQRGPFPETGTNTKVAPVGFFFAFDQAFAP